MLIRYNWVQQISLKLLVDLFQQHIWLQREDLWTKFSPSHIVPLAFHEKPWNYLFISQFYISMLGHTKLFLSLMELIVRGNNRNRFNATVWMFTKATLIVSQYQPCVMPPRSQSVTEKSVVVLLHLSSRAHAKQLMVPPITNFRSFPSLLSWCCFAYSASSSACVSAQEVVLHVEECKELHQYGSSDDGSIELCSGQESCLRALC